VGSSFDTVLYALRRCGEPETELACNDDASVLTRSSQFSLSMEAGEQLVLILDSYNQGGEYTLRAERTGEPPECQEGEQGIAECGLNGRGEQRYRCAEGSWEEDGGCVDPDICPDGEASEEPCPGGTRTGECVEGDWVWADCISEPVPGVCPPDREAQLGQQSGETSGTQNLFGSGCVTGEGPEQSWSFRAEQGGLYRFDTFGTDFDTVLSILSACPNSVELECNDDAQGTQSMVELELEPGAELIIVVDGYYSSAMGPYQLNISHQSCHGDLYEPNDDLRQAPFVESGDEIDARICEDDVDNYRLELERGCSLHAEVSFEGTELSFEILDSVGQIQDEGIGDLVSLNAEDLRGGIYNLRIQGLEVGDFLYRLYLESSCPLPPSCPSDLGDWQRIEEGFYREIICESPWEFDYLWSLAPGCVATVMASWEARYGDWLQISSEIPGQEQRLAQEREHFFAQYQAEAAREDRLRMSLSALASEGLPYDMELGIFCPDHLNCPDDDPREPDNSREEANPLGEMESIGGILCGAAGDHFSAQIGLGCSLRAELKYFEPDAEPFLYISDAEGQLLDQGQLLELSPMPGEIFIEVRGNAELETPYLFNFDLICPPVERCLGSPDPYEPNETALSATPIEPGLLEAGICQREADLYRLESGELCLLEVDLEISGEADVRLEYRSGDLELGRPERLAYADSISAGQHLSLQTDDLAYLGVVRWDEEGGFPYELEVQRECASELICPDDDAYEPNDDSGEATPLGALDRRIGILCDDDFYQIEAQEGCWIQARADSVSGDALPQIEILNSRGQRRGSGQGEALAQAHQSESHFIRLRRAPGLRYLLSVALSCDDEIYCRPWEENQACLEENDRYCWDPSPGDEYDDLYEPNPGSEARRPSESQDCQDGMDNDGDGLRDRDDPECQCEAGVNCAGFEDGYYASSIRHVPIPRTGRIDAISCLGAHSQDNYAIYLEPGCQVEAQIAYADLEAPAPALNILNGFGNTEALSDQGGRINSTRAHLHSSGFPLYLKVEPERESPYILNLRSDCPGDLPCLEEAGEDNDSIRLGTPIEGSAQGQICPASDRDYHRFHAQAGCTIRARLDFDGELGDLNLSLRARRRPGPRFPMLMPWFTKTLSSSTRTYSSLEEIEFVADLDDDYFLLVYQWGEEQERAPRLSYQLDVEVICPQPLVINELDYDNVSSDRAEFVEILNVGSEPVDLAPLELRHINGHDGGIYRITPLGDAGILEPGRYLVVGVEAVLAGVPATVLRLSWPDNALQNGAPDALALVDREREMIIDSLSYEGFMEGWTEGEEGTPSDTGSPNALSRCPNGVDQDNNAEDFSLVSPTAGRSNECP